jgi:hypothetical protein
MIKKYDFIDKTIHLIREKLEDSFPTEDTLEVMLEKTKELLKEIV